MTKKIYGQRWEIIEQRGKGGQGHVFDVTDTTEQYKEKAVLKRIINQKRIGRFKKEIEAYLKLEHPNIPQLIDYSLESPAFLVLPLIEGGSLASIAPIGKLEALDVFIRLCEVVKYAHDQGVIHRDLKPDNILVGPDRNISVIDFGLSYFVDEEERLTETMEQVGSKFYIAPELEGGRSDTITEKVDVYSLGKILYFLLTGKHIAREDYLGRNELVKIFGDIQLNYITERLLAYSIVEIPEKRKEVFWLCDQATNIRRLIFEHFYPARKGSPCRFCGEGLYENGTDYHISLRYKTPGGRGGTRSESFDTLVCSSCRHVEWFLK